MVDKNTDFSKSLIDDSDFLKFLHEKGSQNIPDEMRNKQELKSELLKRGMDENQIEYCLGLSQLPVLKDH